MLKWIRSFLEPHKPPPWVPLMDLDPPADLVFEIARIEMKPGDVLVLRSKQRLSSVQIDRLAEHVRPALGNNKCLVLDRSLDLAVLTKSDIEALST